MPMRGLTYNLDAFLYMIQVNEMLPEIKPDTKLIVKEALKRDATFKLGWYDKINRHHGFVIDFGNRVYARNDMMMWASAVKIPAKRVSDIKDCFSLVIKIAE